MKFTYRSKCKIAQAVNIVGISAFSYHGDHTTQNTVLTSEFYSAFTILLLFRSIISYTLRSYSNKTYTL